MLLLSINVYHRCYVTSHFLFLLTIAGLWFWKWTFSSVLVEPTYCVEYLLRVIKYLYMMFWDPQWICCWIAYQVPVFGAHEKICLFHVIIAQIISFEIGSNLCCHGLYVVTIVWKVAFLCHVSHVKFATSIQLKIFW